MLFPSDEISVTVLMKAVVVYENVMFIKYVDENYIILAKKR